MPEDQTRTPERHQRAGHDDGRHDRPQELLAQVGHRGLAPGQQRRRAGQEQQHQADGRHPLVEERRPDRQPLAGDRLAQRREHRRKQHEERAEQQDPVVRQERRFPRQPRVQLVARPQQRQPIDHPAEAERQDRGHERGEHPRQLAVLAKGVHGLHDARARHEGAEDRQQERHDDQRDVPDAQHAAPFLHDDRVQERRRREPRQQARVLDRIPAPVAAPAQLLVRPDHAEREAEGEEQPADHRPAPHGPQPGVVEIAGDQRRHAERVRDRHPHKADVERRRVNDHVRVLEQRVEPPPFSRRRGEERVERVPVNDHQEQEERLDDRDDGDDVRDQLAVPLAVGGDGERAEDRQQEHPEEDRAVQAAPVRRDLVEERLLEIGIALDVLDRVVADDERVDDDAGGDRHQRRGQVQGADPRLDHPGRAAPRAGDRGRGRVDADDEGRQQNERAKGCHGVSQSAVQHSAFGPAAVRRRDAVLRRRPWVRTSTGTWP